MTKILAISDTHERHYSIKAKPCDILIHSGDFTHVGGLKSILNFLTWFANQEAKHKILIAGNHEFTLDPSHPFFNPLTYQVFSEFCGANGIAYLYNDVISVEGLTIVGSPNTPIFGTWGFMKTETELADIYYDLPEAIDILVTHGPPEGILDKNSFNGSCGSRSLRAFVSKVKPKAHIFGHIHESFGTMDHQNTKFVNASVYDNDPIEFDLEEQQ